MKRTIFQIISIISGLIFMSGCSADEQLTFDQPAAVYVSAAIDSTEFTFATLPESVTTDTFDIPLRIIGVAAATDREVSFQPGAESTAKAGYHYNIAPAIIKANEFSATLPVIIYRRPGLKDSLVTVRFEVKENENFKLGYVDQLDYKLTISDILLKPAIWDAAWKGYFGDFSIVKFKFLLEATGRTNWNSFPFPQDSRFLSQRAKNALLEYNQANGDLIDENGEIVTFP